MASRLLKKYFTVLLICKLELIMFYNMQPYQFTLGTREGDVRIILRYTVFCVSWDTFFLVNRVEHQKLG